MLIQQVAEPEERSAGRAHSPFRACTDSVMDNRAKGEAEATGASPDADERSSNRAMLETGVESLPGGPDVTCLVVESFAPVRARLVEALTRRGLRVADVVNHVEAVRYMATHGVPSCFVISGSVGRGAGIALARGLGRLEKTRLRPVVLLLDSDFAKEQAAAEPLHDQVMPLTRYGSPDELAAALVEQVEQVAADAPPEGPADLAGPSPEAAENAAEKAAAEDERALTEATGVGKEQLLALDDAFYTFEKVATMVRDNKLPGPMVPDLLSRVVTLFKDPDIEFKHVTIFVGQHQTLAARLLAVSNSALYARFGGRAKSLDVALSRLGLRETQSQMMTIAARSFVVGKDPTLRARIQASLESAYIVAVVARDLGRRAKLQTRTDPYQIGLFHNVGSIFLLYTVALLHDRGQLAKVDYPAIDTMIASRSEDLNALVCDKLNLPTEVVAIYSASPPKAAEKMVAVMHQSMWVAEKLVKTRDPEQLQVDSEAEMLGFNKESLAELRAEAPKWLEMLEIYAR